MKNHQKTAYAGEERHCRQSTRILLSLRQHEHRCFSAIAVSGAALCTHRHHVRSLQPGAPKLVWMAVAARKPGRATKKTNSGATASAFFLAIFESILPAGLPFVGFIFMNNCWAGYLAILPSAGVHTEICVSLDARFHFALEACINHLSGYRRQVPPIGLRLFRRDTSLRPERIWLGFWCR